MAKKSMSTMKDHMKFAGKVNEGPDFIAPLTSTHQANQNNIQTMLGRKVNDVYYGITSTPSHNPAPLRYKFVEDLSPILQDRNIVQRRLKSRIPLPSNSQSVPVLKGLGQSKMCLSRPTTNLNQKESNPPMVCRTGRRVSFEINVQYSSVSDSDRGLEMQVCQQTVTARSKSNINIPTRQQVSFHMDKGSVDSKEGPIQQLVVCNSTSHSYKGFESVNQHLTVNKSTSLHAMDNHNYTKSKINTPLGKITENNRSKSILKKSTLAKDKFEADKVMEEYDDDDDDDIFGVREALSRKLNFELGHSDSKVKKDYELQTNDDKNIVVPLEVQKHINTDSNKNIKVQEENTLNILEKENNATEKNIRRLTSSKRMKTSLLKKKHSNLNNNAENILNKSSSKQEENCNDDNIPKSQVEEQEYQKNCLKRNKNVEYVNNKVTKKGNKNGSENEQTSAIVVNKNIKIGKSNTKIEKVDTNILVENISPNTDNNSTNKTKKPKTKNVENDKQNTRKKKNSVTSDDVNDLFKTNKSTDKNETKNIQKNQKQKLSIFNNEMEIFSSKMNNVANKKRAYSLCRSKQNTKTEGRSKIAKKTDVFEFEESNYSEKNVDVEEKVINVENEFTGKEINFDNKESQNVDYKSSEKQKVFSKTEDIVKHDVNKAVKSNCIRKTKRTKQRVDVETPYSSKFSENGNECILQCEVLQKKEIKDEKIDTVKETIEYVVTGWLYEENQNENKSILRIESIHTKQQENTNITDFKESKLELSTKRLKRKEESKQDKKRKITVIETKDENEKNESSRGQRHSFRKRKKTSEFWRLSQPSQNPIEIENENQRVSSSNDLSLTLDDENIVQMPPGYIVDKMPCFSSIEQCFKTVEPGVNECLGITVNKVSCGGHIFIKPGKSYKKKSSNNIMFTVIKGTAHVRIYKTEKTIEENKFFFVPHNVPFQINNQKSKKLIVCFVKIPMK